MSGTSYIYQESMNEAELSFLKTKEAKDMRVFTRTIRNISILFVVLPCCIGIIMESISRSMDTPVAKFKQEDDPYFYLYYFFGMIFLLILIAIGSYYSYSRTLKLLLKDIHLGNKTIEKTEIDRKQFVEMNNTYHFYLKSASKLSIEVSKDDFDLYREGDEINIEYSTFSKIYFGYF